MKNYYQILQVSENAADQDIRRSYRRLALQFHPDINRSAHSIKRFIALNEAYRVLKDPYSRKRYNKILLIFKKFNKNNKVSKRVHWPVHVHKAVVLGPHRTISFVKRKSLDYHRRSHWKQFWEEISDFFKLRFDAS